jgi:murein DD-endopeptidase MepM/ murein hydrolase activator NlpD
MPLYTMSGKRTTIAERDSTSEEERIAEIKARLFTLFDEEDEREREYEEQNRLRNRATGTFKKIRDMIGDGEDERSGETASSGPAANRDGRRDSGERQRRPDAAKRAARPERLTDPAGEEPRRARVEQERRVRPVNPVRAMDTERIGERGRPDTPDGAYDESRRPSPEYAESLQVEPSPAPQSKEPKAQRERKEPEAANQSVAAREDRQPEGPDTSFRLGDLFKEKEPDIFSMWEREDEEEKRIRERRERRRAEAARRVHGEEDDSKMKTAAALFIAREGMRNFFGKFSGPLGHDDEREEEEREAEKALRELAETREDGNAPSQPAGQDPLEQAVAGDDDREERRPRRTKDGIPGRSGPLSGRPAKRPAPSDEKDGIATASGRSGDAPARERTAAPRRSDRRAAAAGMRTKSAEAAPASQEDAGEEGLFFGSLRSARLSRTAIAWIAGGAAGVAAVVIIAFIIVNSHAVGVSVAGADLGYVEDKDSFTKLVADVKADIARDAKGADIVIDDAEVVLADTVRSDDRAESLDAEELKEALLEKDAVKARGYTINVNGKPMVSLPTEAAAEGVLDGIVGKYAAEAGSAEYEWQDNVEITNEAVELSSLTATPEAINYLLTGNEVEKKIEVEDGDTLWGISEETGYEVDEIVEANPDIDPDRVHTGDVLSLNDIEPFVHVKTTEIVTKDESIDYETIEKKSGEIYEGRTKVETEGRKGERTVTLEQTKVNGEVVESRELSSEVLRAPEDEVVLVGTKERDGWYYTEGGGSLGRPLRSLSVSSEFGWRTHPISGANRQHTGVDFRAAPGTSVYSAEDGTVATAGWNGGYGNLVTVNHGGGVVTYYAHLSSIGVSPGERVGRGQRVGRVGSTGSSTGPHLHFEVRIGGAPQNPMSYL